MSNNSNLLSAKTKKNDEFYTHLSDIRSEILSHQEYIGFFYDKTVLCNCNDAESSSFFIFFKSMLREGKIKQLIVIHYNPDNKPSYGIKAWVEDGLFFESKFPLKENGDFRSDECIDILQQADVVCSNPPFTLAREYIKQLIQYNKKFLIIGNKNILSCKDIFPLIQKDKMWLGYNTVKEFDTPDGVQKFGNIGWLTNIEICKRNCALQLKKSYYAEKKLYQKFDDYDAINVNTLKDIPKDYDGVMGVPITFLEHYNPNQFKIIGLSQRGCHKGFPETKHYNDCIEMRPDGTPTGSSGAKTNENGNLVMNDGKHNYFINKDGRTVQSCYKRVFIKKVEN